MHTQDISFTKWNMGEGVTVIIQIMCFIILYQTKNQIITFAISYTILFISINTINTPFYSYKDD